MATTAVVERERKLDMALDDLVSSGHKRQSKGEGDRSQKRRRTSDSSKQQGGDGRYGDKSGEYPGSVYGGHSYGGYNYGYNGVGQGYGGHDQGYNQNYNTSYNQGKSYGEGRSSGKGSGRNGGGARKRLPPEDKALLHTRAFFASSDEFVVKLHETEVFTLKSTGQTSQANAPGANPIRFVRGEGTKDNSKEQESKKDEVAKEEGKDTSGGKEAPVDLYPDLPDLDDEEDILAAEKTGGEEAGAAAATPAAPAADQDKDAHWPHSHTRQDELDLPDFGSDDEDGEAAGEKDGKLPRPETQGTEAAEKSKEGHEEKTPATLPQQTAPGEASKQGVVISLNSGTYRTLETKYIMNEALETFNLKISESDSASSWVVSGENFKTLDFEDKMEFTITGQDKQTAGSAIKSRLEKKVAAVKGRDSKTKSGRGEPYSDRRGSGRQDGGRDSRPPPGVDAGGAPGAPPGHLGWGAWPPIHPASPLYRPPIMPAYGYYPHPLHPPSQPAAHPHGPAPWSTGPPPRRPKPRAGETLPDSYFQ